MIQNPYLLAACFGAIVSFVFWAKGQKFFAPAFRFLPVPFWCYFLPMLGATAGLFPPESPLYGFLSRYLLPVCLAMLLINVDLRALVRLGRPALLAMAAGCAGVMIGAVLAYALFHGRLPAESWKAVGALSASWTGGSANMLAVKESLSTPENVFAPIIVVDTFMAYAWMALLISFAGLQDRFDRWNRADTRGLDPAPASADRVHPWPWPIVPVVCLGLGLASFYLGDRFGGPLSAALSLGSVFSKATWSILFVTTLSLALSLTGRFSASAERTEKWGTALLYLLLASMGARAALTAILETPFFLLVGLVILLAHGTVLFLAGRLLRSPLFLLAAASQACVGGTVSAPLVAAVYRPALSAVGLLLAIFGNVLGTYLGLLTARLCLWIAG